MQYKTLALDSASEVGRLFFSWDMKKKAGDLETIRKVNNYPGATERLNMLFRRFKDYRDHKTGVEIVVTAHEDMQRIYAKGSGIGSAGERAPEPVAVKGLPDLPGTTAPEECCRAADNVFRVRLVNNQAVWVATPESIGPGAGNWLVKDRFGAVSIKGGYLPASHEQLVTLASNLPNWDPPYIWVIYGPFGIGKTRSLRSFPKPILILDIDRGTSVIKEDLRSINGEVLHPEKEIDVLTFNSEESSEYPRFISTIESVFK